MNKEQRRNKTYKVIHLYETILIITLNAIGLKKNQMKVQFVRLDFFKKANQHSIVK